MATHKPSETALAKCGSVTLNKNLHGSPNRSIGVVDDIHSGMSRILWSGFNRIHDRNGDHLLDARNGCGNVVPYEIDVRGDTPCTIVGPPVVRIMVELPIRI